MTNEERIEYLEGQVTILKHSVALLIAMHPHREEIAPAIKNILSYPEIESSSKNYKAGSKDIVDTVSEQIEIAVLAEQSRRNPHGIS